MFFVYGFVTSSGGRRHCRLLGAAADEETAKRRATGWFVHAAFDCVYIKDSTSRLIHFFRCTARRRAPPQPAAVLRLRPPRA